MYIFIAPAAAVRAMARPSMCRCSTPVYSMHALRFGRDTLLRATCRVPATAWGRFTALFTAGRGGGAPAKQKDEGLRGEHEYGYSWGRPKWNVISYFRGYSMIFHL